MGTKNIAKLKILEIPVWLQTDISKGLSPMFSKIPCAIKL